MSTGEASEDCGEGDGGEDDGGVEEFDASTFQADFSACEGEHGLGLGKVEGGGGNLVVRYTAERHGKRLAVWRRPAKSMKKVGDSGTMDEKQVGLCSEDMDAQRSRYVQ